MPSIFTLGGAAAPKAKRPRKRKAKAAACVVGTCRDVKNSRTGKTVALCCVGKAVSKTGHRFMSAEQAREFRKG